MSDANRVRLSYIKESAFGVTPVGNLQLLRYTSESLKQDTTTTKSNEIRDDRQTSDVTRTDLKASGDINTEWSYGNNDDLLCSALQGSAWSSAVVITAVTLSAAAADNSFNDSANGLAGLSVGQWVRVSGFVTAANVGIFKILTKAAGKITVSGGTLINEAAGPSVKINQGAQIVNGVTLDSYTFERKYTDLTNTYSIFKGECIEQFTQSIKAQQIITSAISFMGINELSAVATVGTGYTAAPTNKVMTATEDVLSFVEGTGSLLGTDILEGTWGIKNNLRNRPLVARLGPTSMGAGSVDITGTVQMYFATAAIMNKYLAFTTSALAFTLRDAANNGYAIDFPSVKYTAGQRVAGGINTDVIANMSFEAKMDTTELIMMRVARFAAP